MKSITQIFETNLPLMEEPEVQDLIDYCRELEGEVMDTEMLEQYNMEDKLGEVVRDIHRSCVSELEADAEADRWSDFDHVNFKVCIRNLKKYISKFAVDNNFRL